MKIIFLAYRDWSLSVYESIQRHPNVQFSVLCKTQVELEKFDLNDFDLIISCGWSEELGEEILSKIKAIGISKHKIKKTTTPQPLDVSMKGPALWARTTGWLETDMALDPKESFTKRQPMR